MFELYLLPVAAYIGVVVYMARCYGKTKTLQFRGVLNILMWPLDLVWPFLVAAVAALELCALLAARRFGVAHVAPRSTDPV